MKIFIASSKHFYNRIPEVKRVLESQGHKITLPNSYEDPFAEEEMKNLGIEEHKKWKSEMLKKDDENISPQDAILVLNFEKDGQENYIGGATFLEIYKAWELRKKIFLLNDIPKNILEDEIKGFDPIILKGDLSKLAPKKIEVEIRSFITKEKYNELIRLCEQNFEFVKEDFQETHYFNCEQDLRIQKNNNGSKIWLKKGKLHEDAREEIEIFTSKDEENFENLGKLFSALGHDVEIKWLRKRNQFNWQGTKVCLDYTKGYGYILELEKISDEENKEEVLQELKEKLYELGIEETPKEIFDEKYNYYKENWRSLI